MDSVSPRQLEEFRQHAKGLQDRVEALEKRVTVLEAALDLVTSFGTFVQAVFKDAKC